MTTVPRAQDSTGRSGLLTLRDPLGPENGAEGGHAAVPPAPTIDVAAELLARRLRRDLSGLGCRVEVRALGLADALGDTESAPWHPSTLPADGSVLPVHLTGRSALVGPVTELTYGRPSSPCPHCLARRWQQIRSVEERDALELGEPPAAAPRPPYVIEFAVPAVAAVVSRAATGRARDAQGHPYVHEVRLDAGEVSRYPLVADSECQFCADRPPDRPERAVIDLADRRKPAPDRYRLRGTRAFSLDPDAYANPVCGALGTVAHPRVESTTTSPTMGVLPVRGSGYMHHSFWGGHADNFDDSTVLGILEGLERHAGLRPRSVERSVLGSYRELADRALDPRDCGLYSEAFHQQNPRYPQFTPDLEIPWCWGWSLRDRRPLLVPEAMAYYHVVHSPNKFLQECSNGCAVGSCMEEAVLHGMLEVVERDAFLLTWFGQAQLPELDSATSRRPETRMLLDRIRMYGYEVRLFDTRVEFPVPVVTAVAQRRDGGHGTLCFGAGASLEPEDAVRSAIGEIAALLPDFTEHSSRTRPELLELAADFSRVVVLHDHPRLYGLPEMAPHADFLLKGDRERVPLEDAFRGWEQRRPRTDSLRDDLTFCLDSLTGAGFDVIAVDQTSPEQTEIGLRTASVLVPGLLPIDFGAGRQRALDMDRVRTTFRRIGWSDRDLEAEDLNPAPHPFP